MDERELFRSIFQSTPKDDSDDLHPRKKLRKTTSTSPSSNEVISTHSGIDDNYENDDNIRVSDDGVTKRNEKMNRDDNVCPLCEQQVKGTMEKHKLTCLHLFNFDQQFRPAIHYALSPNSFGYKLMRDKYNWDEDSGLGKDGTGRHFPVKTTLKQDRAGLGSVKNPKPCITHHPLTRHEKLRKTNMAAWQFEETKRMSAEEKKARRVRARAEKRKAKDKRRVKEDKYKHAVYGEDMGVYSDIYRKVCGKGNQPWD